MTRYAVAAALSGLMLAMGACSAPPPRLLPPRVAPSSMPLPRKMSARPVAPAAARAPEPGALTCEPYAAPRFDDPNNPNTITNKACGSVDGNGNARSADPWIDDQLTATRDAPPAPSMTWDPCAGLTYEQCHGIPDPPESSTEPSAPPVTTTAVPTTSRPPISSAPAEARNGSPTTSDSPTTSGSAPTTRG